MKTIEIIDSGQDRYTLKCDTNILGRRYDNIAETITIVKPATEVDSVCILVATYGGNVIDHIIVQSNTIDITSNLSQYESVNIGFSFSRPDGYVKGSEIKQFKFLPAPKPDGFVPVPSEQKATIDYLAQYGFVDAVLDNNILKFKNYSGDDVKEVQLSGFVQEQSDWNETNDKSETYIKNKPTKLSQFENDLDLEVQDASTTQKGIIQIATDDDIAAGTNETKAVTPKQLKNASSGGIDLNNSEFVSQGSYDDWQSVNEDGTQGSKVSMSRNNMYISYMNVVGESGVSQHIMLSDASIEITSMSMNGQSTSQGYMYFDGGNITISSQQFSSDGNIEYHLETPDLENSNNYSTEYVIEGSQSTQRKLYSNKEEIIFNDGSTKITHTFDKNGLTLNNVNALTENTGILKQQGTENAGKVLTVGEDGNVTPQASSGGGSSTLNTVTLFSSTEVRDWLFANINSVTIVSIVMTTGSTTGDITAPETIVTASSSGVNKTTQTSNVLSSNTTYRGLTLVASDEYAVRMSWYSNQEGGFELTFASSELGMETPVMFTKEVATGNSGEGQLVWKICEFEDELSPKQLIDTCSFTIKYFE